MSEQKKEAIESLCKTLKKTTPEQDQYLVGFAEGIVYANERDSSKREQNDNE